MALENPLATYIPQLQPADPTGQDSKSQGDDHIRQLKSVLQNQFPNIGSGPVTASHTELNALVGIDANVQTQLDDLILVKGAAGFTSGQTGYRFTVPANQVWEAYRNPAATEYSTGSFVSVNAATGVISIDEGITPAWVHLHATLSLRPPASTLGIADWTITRAKFIRGSGDAISFDRSVYITRIPNTSNGQLVYTINCIDDAPAAVGEFYQLQLNSDWAFEMDAEVWSMNVWAEVTGK